MPTEASSTQKCGIGGIGGKLLLQWWRGCCGVELALGGYGSMVTSLVVVVGSVVGSVVDGAVEGVVVVVRDDAGVDGRVVVGAGELPPLPRARTSRP
ncbi:MAG: hypothetical protein QOD34_982 [Mycobacterium sp.]|jgi:hypothetical protein|nr:hypothetical protein [Mycobacterium sp.]